MELRIHTLRVDAGITQQEIAHILGVSPEIYVRYETGDSDMPGQILMLLAQYLDTSSDYIVGLTNEKKPYPRSK